jgi:Trypsin-like peptidase domain
MTGHRRRILWIVALTAILLVLGVLPADAHQHPTPIERSAPGVVYVEARAQVDVALVEHRQSDPVGIHIAIIQSTSTPVLASASGFVVEPTGTIVSSGAIHAMTDADMDRARIYGVNEAFRKQYGAQAPLSGDLFTRQRVGADTDLVEQRLEACYPPNHTNDAGGCVVRVTPSYVVYPYVTDQGKYGELPAELLAASTKDVAVLQVRGANGLPTVALGESREGARALSALGFTGIPGPQHDLQAINTHLAEVGGSVLKTEGLKPEEAADNARLAEGLKNGMRGGPVVAEDGQVIGTLEPDAGSGPPPETPGRLVDIGAIRQVLSAERITPRRGPVDTSFEAAMHPFKNGGYAAAVPNFKKALELFPGHFLAAKNLAEAQQKVAAGSPGPTLPAGSGTATDAGGAGGFPWTVVLLVLAAVLLVAALATLLLHRHRRSSAAGGGAPPTGTPGPGVTPPAPPRPGEGRPATPSRTAAGHRERQGAPSAATGSGPGSVAVIEGGGSGRNGVESPGRGAPAPSGGAPSPSISGQRSAAAGGEGASKASRASAPPPSVSSSGLDDPVVAATGNRPAFCTSCGGSLAAQHRFCGRCGAAVA